MNNRPDQYRKKHRRFRGSIFLKILLVLFITGVVINFSMVGFHRLFEGPRHEGVLRKNLENYAEYIIEDLGVPPDKDRAARFQKEFSFHIRYDSPENSWATTDNFPSMEELERKRTFHGHGHMGGRKGQFYYVVKKDHGTFIFATDFRRFFKPGKPFFAGLIALLTLILTGSYMAIRWIFKPVKWLDEGAREIGKGNLDHRIPVRKRRDELGELAVSFNEMAERIQQMMRAKEQLLLDVSHELRSPVTRMRVALEFVPEGEKKEGLLEDVAELEAMITELLESEKLNSDHGKLTLETVDLADLLRNTIKEFEKRPPGIKLAPVLENLEIEADAERVKVVMKNVFENAIKYSNPDSRAVDVTARKEDNATLVSVRDYGIGIPKKDLPNIFEPFYRADKSRSRDTGGYGLGMSLCKKIMDAHDGSIGIESRQGEGTTVTLKFR